MIFSLDAKFRVLTDVLLWKSYIFHKVWESTSTSSTVLPRNIQIQNIYSYLNLQCIRFLTATTLKRKLLPQIITSPVLSILFGFLWSEECLQLKYFITQTLGCCGKRNRFMGVLSRSYFSDSSSPYWFQVLTWGKKQKLLPKKAKI